MKLKRLWSVLAVTLAQVRARSASVLFPRSLTLVRADQWLPFPAASQLRLVRGPFVLVQVNLCVCSFARLCAAPVLAVCYPLQDTYRAKTRCKAKKSSFCRFSPMPPRWDLVLAVRAAFEAPQGRALPSIATQMTARCCQRLLTQLQRASSTWAHTPSLSALSLHTPKVTCSTFQDAASGCTGASSFRCGCAQRGLEAFTRTHTQARPHNRCFLSVYTMCACSAPLPLALTTLQREACRSGTEFGELWNQHRLHMCRSLFTWTCQGMCACVCD